MVPFAYGDGILGIDDAVVFLASTAKPKVVVIADRRRKAPQKLTRYWVLGGRDLVRILVDLEVNFVRFVRHTWAPLGKRVSYAVWGAAPGRSS